MGWRRFVLWRDGVVYALQGGIWLHPFLLRGERWAHLVSADRDALLRAGVRLRLRPEWLQYRPLKHPVTGVREAAWHWDLRGPRLELALALAPRREPPRSGRNPHPRRSS